MLLADPPSSTGPGDADGPRPTAAEASAIEEHALDTFQTAVSSACAPVRIRPAQGASFQGQVRSARADGLLVASLTTGANSVSRTGRLLSSTDPEFVKLTWPRHGVVRLTQDGRECEIRAGSLVVYETIRPYQLHTVSPRWEAVVVAVPRDRLEPHLRQLSERTAVPVPATSGPARALALMVDELARCDDAGLGDSAAAIHLGDALVSMLLAVYNGLPQIAGAGRINLADRVRAHALAHLGDPGLSVDSIAAALGVSVRQVHKMCAQEGFSAAAWIRRRRLERIRRDLLDPALAGRTTPAIAARWGILDTTHLARQFRAAFGESPAELRRQHTRAA
ncbi:helix-turn-helix domain-containing protein [Modestobacter roseus]|uniref:AraC-like DNA-binding protein n=1 Tax=Modestobacter roseus TaxID=1181884 RepID=A0A562IPC8_9ACTN|nr:helix-turn-helix domain-containing protein [Modestobacter roseus]MQA34425.1 helix-turn-helix domain-containing protein [Modestobacter roseus]TWH72752.1 AraC-like DNA-binding protein [Modestobacter roseus]